MKKKLLVWMCLVVFLSSSIQLGNAVMVEYNQQDNFNELTKTSTITGAQELPPIPIGATYVQSFYTGGERGITHDDSYLYCAGVSNIYVYDMSTSTVVRTLNFSYSLMGLAHDGQYLYAADPDGMGTIHRLDPVTGSEMPPSVPGTTCNDLAGLTYMPNDDFWLSRYVTQYCSRFNLSTGMFHANIPLTLGNSWGLANDGYHLFIVGGEGGAWGGVPTIQVYASDLESKVSEFNLDYVQNWQGLTYWNGRLYLQNNSGYTYEFMLQYDTPPTTMIEYTGNHSDYIFDHGDHKSLVFELEFEVNEHSNYDIEFTMRNTRNTWSYTVVRSEELSPGYHWIEFDFSAESICQGFDNQFVYDSVKVYDMNDGRNEVYYHDFGGLTTSEYYIGDLRTGNGEKIAYIGGNTTEWTNDLSNHSELVIRMGFEVQYGSNYRIYLVLEDGYSTAWETSHEAYLAPGVHWINFVFFSFDLIPSEWSSNDGGPFNLSYLTICDTYSSSLDWYELDFYQTNHYTPSDFGVTANMFTYTWNFNDYVDYSGDPRLMLEFEFEVHLSGQYYGELVIRDNRGFTWTSSFSNYLPLGYCYVGWFEFSVQNILDSGFSGGEFAFQRLSIYEQGTDLEVFTANDFQSTGYYSREDLEPRLQLNSRYEQIVEENNMKGLVFYFEFNIFQQSLYRVELTIRDSRGYTWNGDNEQYLYEGYQQISVPFWSDYLFNDPGFQGSTFNLQYLRITDRNDNGIEVFSQSELGDTRYYDRSEFDIGPTVTFGVQVGDYLELHVSLLDCNDAARDFLGSLFVMTAFNQSLSVYQNDVLRYTISSIDNGNVYANIQHNGVFYSEVHLYSSDPDSFYSSFFLLSLEDLDNIYEIHSESIVTEDSESYIINMDNEGTQQTIKYDKVSGFVSYLVLYNYNYEDVQINQLEVTSDISASGPGKTDTSTGITFSTTGFELLVVILAIPAVLFIRRKRK